PRDARIHVAPPDARRLLGRSLRRDDRARPVARAVPRDRRRDRALRVRRAVPALRPRRPGAGPSRPPRHALPDDRAEPDRGVAGLPAPASPAPAERAPRARPGGRAPWLVWAPAHACRA